MAVVAATLAAILDGMKGGKGAGFDHPSGECNNSKHSGWERVIVVAATNCVDAIPSYLRRPRRLEREVVVRPPNSGGRHKLYPAAADNGDKCNECDDEVGL